MAFIRRVRTSSGATAVQIAVYAEGSQRIVQHVGSAHTQAELGMLLQRARDLLEDPQGVLDLAVVPAPPVVPVVRPRGRQGLFELADGAAAGVRDGPGRVVSTDSRVLFEALAGVFTALGFAALGDEVFAELVIVRVVEPTSLLDVGRVLRDLGRAPASYATMKRTLKRVGAASGAGTYRDQVAALCFEHASASGDVSLVLYDVTTLYFEAEKEDDLRKVGFSKERRVDPQVVVGLLVDREGFRWRSAASRATRPRRPPSSRSSRRSRPATTWPTWWWSPTPGCCRRRTCANSTRRTCGSSSDPGSPRPRSTSPPTSAGTATHSPTGS